MLAQNAAPNSAVVREERASAWVVSSDEIWLHIHFPRDGVLHRCAATHQHGSPPRTGPALFILQIHENAVLCACLHGLVSGTIKAILCLWRHKQEQCVLSTCRVSRKTPPTRRAEAGTPAAVLRDWALGGTAQASSGCTCT
eukprot:m.57445 g.57445  ORF g.57445 m.57445 type:complete len:141 (+) comp15606_c0_seq8:670-1092(+)